MSEILRPKLPPTTVRHMTRPLRLNVTQEGDLTPGDSARSGTESDRLGA